MTPELHLTSLAFALPAILGRDSLYGPAFTLLLGLSVLNHARAREVYLGKLAVRIADLALAHGLAACITRESLAAVRSSPPFAPLPVLFVWASLAYVVHNFYVRQRGLPPHSQMRRQLHAAVHAVGAVGASVFIHYRRRGMFSG
jgi:hypothetical protein